MKLPRRRFVGLAADVAALTVTSWIAEAQAYPTRSITMSDGVRRDSLRMGPEPSREAYPPSVDANRLLAC